MPFVIFKAALRQSNNLLLYALKHFRKHCNITKYILVKANDAIWNEYLDAGGFKGGVWRWWPETGSSIDTDYDYLLAASFSTVEDYGAARDGRLQAMLSGTRPAEIHDCNMPRLYKSTNIRLNLPSEG